MKKHNGMRPLDIVVLLKISSKKMTSWYMKDLANELEISASEISESINRSVFSGLLNEDKKTIKKQEFINFIEYGLPFVFPTEPGNRVKGMGTAHSAIPLYNRMNGIGQFVWKFGRGNLEGQSLKPLHPNVPNACMKDDQLYEYIALVDVIRMGNSNMQEQAIRLLKEGFEN